MKQLQGKTAFVTGGASGIGLAMARAFGTAGMAVMIADIEADALAAAVAALQAEGLRVQGAQVDVTSRASVQEAAERTVHAFGKVHLVANNAGVGSGGRLNQIPERDWPWVFDVNVMGVVFGVETFTPLIRSHGEGGHFVNTASINGFLPSAFTAPYSGSKAAVVALSEAWAGPLATRGIGVSILCPGVVDTRFVESRRNRPAAYGGQSERSGLDAPEMAAGFKGGLPPASVAARVLEAVLADELYVFTNVEYRDLMKARFDAVLAAFDRAAASPAVAALPPRVPPIWRG